MTKSRLAYIDISKGLLILFVIIGHIPYFIGHSHHDIHNSFCELIGSVSAYAFAPYFMTAFFLITGYCTNFQKDFKLFFITTFKSLKIPAVSLSAISLVIYKICDGVDSPLEYFHLGLIHSWYISLFWFLDVLFLARLLYWLINKIDNIYIRGLICLVLYCYTYYCNCFDLYPNYGYHRHAFFYSFYLFLGQILRITNFDFGIKSTLVFSLIYVTLVFGLLSWGIPLPNISGPIHVTEKDVLFFWLIMSVTGSIGIIGICRHIRYCRILEFLGKNSLIFYCFHLVLLHEITPVYRLIDPDNYILSMLFFLLILAFVVIICSVLSKLFTTKYGKYLIGKF